MTEPKKAIRKRRRRVGDDARTTGVIEPQKPKRRRRLAGPIVPAWKVAGGEPALPRIQLTLTDQDISRFLEKIDPPNVDGCTLWNASKFAGGYGQFKLKGRSVLAHRVAWTLQRGTIPDDLVLDHVYLRGCRSKACVNTAHLELVTHEENARRRDAAERWRASVWVSTELDEG
ncbi:HNH endonuclease signature motif containing protein [Streptomyces sp. NPDC006864]|uniref:HNH endonuclease signature motif containing protein n=1 Tax=Streptomyces sp. NPDC006864 TaxID=3154780 RepID=UPI00345509DF